MQLSSIFAVLINVLLALATPLAAGSLMCTPKVEISFDDPTHGEMACAAVRKTEALLQQCGLPALDSEIEIALVQNLKAECVAVYHCGEGVIQALSPDALDTRRGGAGLFAKLPTPTYFSSVLVHELAHAATDPIPCPFDSCVAAQEYVAYGLQIMSLPPEAITQLEAEMDARGSVTLDELNAFILFMAPDVFASKVWRHLSDQEDRCGYLKAVAAGRVTLDQGEY